MELYTVKNDTKGDKAVVIDDMILTADMPTTAGSKMLETYVSPFEAEVVTRLKNAGYEISGKAKVGEFAVDLMGETCFQGAVCDEETIKSAAHEIVKSGEVFGAVCLDVNGSVLRGSATSGICSIKPTYGTVSRYGTIPTACSGETVSIVAKTASDCEKILKVVAGHDDKDGTSLPDEKCMSALGGGALKKKALLFTDMYDKASDEVKAKLDKVISGLTENGVEIVKADSGVIAKSGIAWNILMSAELCNNVSRYDGVKYGYRSGNYTNIDELYTNSRTEAFGDVLKTVILYGSETLSTDNYMKVYDKAMRVRRVICEEFEKLFGEYDVVIMPAASFDEYKKEQVDGDKYLSFKENVYTAPAFIAGLPAMVCKGVMFMSKPFGEKTLLNYAEMCEKECE